MAKILKCVIPSNAEETYGELQGSFEQLSDKFFSFKHLKTFQIMAL